MIDFHTHILPVIDDGSADVDMSAKMLNEEHSQGVDKIIATPHFYAHRDYIESFLERRDVSYRMIKEMFPSILLGAEVYYFEGIGKAQQLSKLCIEGTNILLLELPFCQWQAKIITDVKDILQKQNLTVMLAHVERYFNLQKDMNIWNKLLEMPVYVQINTGSFLKWQKRRTSYKILKNGYKTVLGSDCHNLTDRAPNLKAGRDMIQQKFGNGIIEEIDELGGQLIALAHRGL